MKSFYDPTPEQLTRLSAPWSAAFSGGKDSTALVTWLEWLRRAGWITAERPQLVRSDTLVEEAGLAAIAGELTATLAASGWECITVTPEVHERLYVQILGRGLPPIHPGIGTMRWCTRSTKIDPMDRGRSALPDVLVLTGRREGESATRDKKLKRSSCAAGGECGIPEPGANTYDPILRWQTCNLLDWLTGAVGKRVASPMADTLPTTRRLVDLYGVQRTATLFAYEETLDAARFGCVGCPAIGAEAAAPSAVRRRYGSRSPLLELYDVWHEARQPQNRIVKVRRGRQKMGPVRMEVRRRLFERVRDIERRAGVTLITPEDEAAIRACWAEGVYPKGTTADDEATRQPAGPLFER